MLFTNSLVSGIGVITAGDTAADETAALTTGEATRGAEASPLLGTEAGEGSGTAAEVGADEQAGLPTVAVEAAAAVGTQRGGRDSLLRFRMRNLL